MATHKAYPVTKQNASIGSNLDVVGQAKTSHMTSTTKRIGSSKPPLQRSSLRSKDPSNSNPQVMNAHLLFEPKPPEKGVTRSNRSPSPSMRRRVQSAKNLPSSHQNQTRPIRTENPAGLRAGGRNRRPLSAVVLGSDGSPACHQQKHATLQHTDDWVPVPKQFLQFDDTVPSPSPASIERCTDEQTNYQLTSQKLFVSIDSYQKGRRSGRETSGINDGRHHENLHYIPEGIAALAPWLTSDVPPELTGLEADPNCLVFVPPMLHESAESLPVVPPLQDSSDVLFHKPRPNQPKPFDPSKLFHYDVEKNRPNLEEGFSRSRPATSKYVQIFSLDGQLLHDESKYNRNRTVQIVKQEIEDLELLLEGVGREGSSNVLVQYQHEVNMLRQAILDTETKCYLLRRLKKKEEEPSDITGLRQFIRERERVLAKIKARREACLLELKNLEASLGLNFGASKD